jgi:hypothetical protein
MEYRRTINTGGALERLRECLTQGQKEKRGTGGPKLRWV